MKITDKIEITNEDCMELLKRTPDKFYDLAICDPPYGIGFDNKIRDKKIKSWDREIPKDDYFKELLRVSKNQIIWGGNYFPYLWVNGCKSFIFWDKDPSVDNYADGELAWTSFDFPSKKFYWAWNGLANGINGRNKTIEKILTVFNNINIGKIVSDISNNKLIRYSNAPNTIDLFSSQLKGSNTGFQNQSNQSGMNIRTKGIHPSFLGNIDIVSTSTNDPGSSFTLTPFCDIKETLHFTDDMSVNVISFNDLDWLKERNNKD